MVSTACLVANSRWFLLTALLLVFSLLMSGLWLAAEARGRNQAGYVETTAEWTRFADPVLVERGRRADKLMVPVHFTYRVGGNDFSGSDMMDQTIFDRWSPQLGGGFRVWYDPAAPSRVVRSLSGPARDATLAGWLALVSGAIALGCAGIGWLRHRRALAG